ARELAVIGLLDLIREFLPSILPSARESCVDRARLEPISSLCHDPPPADRRILQPTLRAAPSTHPANPPIASSVPATAPPSRPRSCRRDRRSARRRFPPG